MCKRSLLLGLLLLVAFTSRGQLYKDAKAPVEARVNDLLGRMTLEEKVAQMSMTTLKGSLDNPVAFGVCESPFVAADEIAQQSVAAKNML